MSDLIERLRGYTLDWNGSEMADDAPALTDVKCGLLREAAARIEALEAAVERAIRQAQNTGIDSGSYYETLVAAIGEDGGGCGS